MAINDYEVLAAQMWLSSTGESVSVSVNSGDLLIYIAAGVQAVTGLGATFTRVQEGSYGQGLSFHYHVFDSAQTGTLTLAAATFKGAYTLLKVADFGLTNWQGRIRGWTGSRYASSYTYNLDGYQGGELISCWGGAVSSGHVIDAGTQISEALYNYSNKFHRTFHSDGQSSFDISIPSGSTTFDFGAIEILEKPVFDRGTTYLLSLTDSTQAADPDGVYNRVDLDSPTSVLFPLPDYSGKSAPNIGVTVSTGFTSDVDGVVLASGVDENFTEWTDSSRWVADATSPTIELSGLPPNSFASIRLRSWKSGDAVTYTGCSLIGKGVKNYTLTLSGSSNTNRREDDVQHFIGADGKLTLEFGNGAKICAIQISTSDSIPANGEIVGLYMKPYSGNASGDTYPFSGNSFSFPEMKDGETSQAGQDIVSGEGNATLLDGDGNATPYVVTLVNDVWLHGASGNGGASYGGLDNGFNTGFALSSWVNSVDNGAKIRIRNLPVGKRYSYYVTGVNTNHRDTDFFVNGEFQRYLADAPTSSTDVPNESAHMLRFDGVVPDSGELDIEFKARADTYASTYYGYLGGSYIALYDDVLLGESDFDQFTVDNYAIGAAGDTFYRDYTPLSSGTVSSAALKIDEFFTCDAFKIVVADATGNHIAVSDEVTSAAGDNQTVIASFATPFDVVAGTTYRLGISLKDTNAGYLRLFGDSLGSTWKWSRIDNAGYATPPNLTGGTGSASGLLPIQLLGEAKKVRSVQTQTFLDADISDQWSGSNFYHEFDLNVSSNTDCLVLRTGGTITNAQSVTLNGVNFTKVLNESDNNAAQIEVWYLMNPPTGTNTFRLDSGASGFEKTYIFDDLVGVDTASTPVFDFQRGWFANRTTSVDGGDGALILSVVAHQDGAVIDYDQTTGESYIDDAYLRSGYNWETYEQSQVGDGATTISATQSPANQGVIVTVAFAYDSGGTSATSIEADNLASTTALDSVAVTQQVGIFIDSLSSMAALDSANVTQNVSAGADDLFSLSALNSVSVSVAGALQPSASTSLSALDTVDVSLQVNISGDALFSLSALDSAAISVTTNVSASDVYSQGVIDSVSADATSGTKTLQANAAASLSVADTVSVSQIASLDVSSLAAQSFTYSAQVTQRSQLLVDELASQAILSSVELLNDTTLGANPISSESALDSVTLSVTANTQPQELSIQGFLDSVLAGIFGMRSISSNLVYFESVTPQITVESVTPLIIVE